MKLLARSALLHPTQNKASVQQPHSSACAALGPRCFPLPPACPGSTARHGYSTGCFLFPCSGCYASLSEETPSHWILDEQIVSCRKGYVHFSPSPSLGWQWPKEVVLEAHPLAPRWRREDISHRQKPGQTKGCLYSISHQPSLFSSPLALALSAYIQRDTAAKDVEGTEAEEKGMSCSWNYPCALVLLLLVTEQRIRRRFGRSRYSLGKRCMDMIQLKIILLRPCSSSKLDATY